MAYQSLYRRYRPRTFSAIKGQPHVVAALQGAVRDQKVGHAYLLHGPRGTGKTTSARVLAKALNCENLQPEGEPCTECESCRAIEEGRSFDLHELDAASNNGVDDMRELIGRVSLGTPGRAKVYLLDEAHMLTKSASNALLKSLEEPPDHVTWVLATTEPHKLVETIRSRCQVFELGLLGAGEMAEHVRWVIDDAGLDVDEAVIDYVVAEGRGSVRDALSALDRVVAAGGHVAADEATERLIDAIAAGDAAEALTAVGEATGRGRDPRTIGELALAGLRDGFLTAMGSPPPRLAEVEKNRADALAGAMTPAAMTRALETLGTALVDMRQAPDPRVDLEVALVRLCRPESDRSLDALAARLERLEQTLGATGSTDPGSTAPGSTGDGSSERGSTGDGPSGTTATPPPVPPAPSASAEPAAAPAVAEPSRASGSSEGPAAARRALAAKKNAAGGSATTTSTETIAAESTGAGAATDPPPPLPSESGSRVDLSALRPGSAREVVEMAAQHLGLDKDLVVARAQEMLEPRSDGSSRDPDELVPLWQALVSEHASPPAAPTDQPPAAGGAEPVESTASGPPPEEDARSLADEDAIDLDDLVDAPTQSEDMIGKLTEAFPGAELINTDDEEIR